MSVGQFSAIRTKSDWFLIIPSKDDKWDSIVIGLNAYWCSYVQGELLGDIHLRIWTEDHCTFDSYYDIENKIMLNLLNNICRPVLYVGAMGWYRGSTQLYPCSYFCKMWVEYGGQQLRILLTALVCWQMQPFWELPGIGVPGCCWGAKECFCVDCARIHFRQ